jgi:hypothetical protein
VTSSDYQPSAIELRPAINAAISATFGIARGRQHRSMRPDGSADAQSVNRVRGLLFKALEALEDGDVAFAYQLAQEAGIELEPPGPAAS